MSLNGKWNSKNNRNETVRIVLLGDFRIYLGKDLLSRPYLQRSSVQTLIKLLALAPGYRFHREQLMELMWPGLDPAGASNRLRQIIHLVRRTFDPDRSTNSQYLQVENGWVQLCSEVPFQTDVSAFENAAREARQTKDVDNYHQAMELYTGDLLPLDLYQDYINSQRQRLRDLYQTLCLDLAERYEAQTDYSQAIESYQKALTIDPCLEDAHRHLMHLYSEIGQRQKAIQQYKLLREALHQELGVSPDPSSRQLYEQMISSILSSDNETASISPSQEPALAHNLPNLLTKFIGRDMEIKRLKQLLIAHQLVTITGIGGIGKSRLALKVASEVIQQYPQGVWWVDLSTLREGKDVPQAVASALGIQEQGDRSLIESLTILLRPGQTLLVLDNCEHLSEACAVFVEKLLASSARLRIFVTSREKLQVSGEAVLSLQGLTLPFIPEPQVIPQFSEPSDAVALFCDRARLVQPYFSQTPENIPYISQICIHVDGMPLAIELAAARINLLPAKEIANRMDNLFQLLSARPRVVNRQQNLRSIVEWSYQQLSSPEQALFSRLAGFNGGWTLEAAEQVCQGRGIEEADILDLLSVLIDKSLIFTEIVQGDVRYRMLETLRQYALERLTESGEKELVFGQHAHYFKKLAEALDPYSHYQDQGTAFLRLEADHKNLQAALEWNLGNPNGDPRAGRSFCPYGIFGLSVVILVSATVG